jgi:hypothetical protein
MLKICRDIFMATNQLRFFEKLSFRVEMVVKTEAFKKVEHLVWVREVPAIVVGKVLFSNVSTKFLWGMYFFNHWSGTANNLLTMT